MYERILAIGDIHGQWDRFMSLYAQIDFHPERDLLVFLGDYIDRGRKSLYVLDWMYEHRNEKNIIMLRGNHEQMMINYYESNGTRDIWLWNGGDVTRRALMKQSDEVQKKCLDFVKSLPLQFQISVGGNISFSAMQASILTRRWMSKTKTPCSGYGRDTMSSTQAKIS